MFIFTRSLPALLLICVIDLFKTINWYINQIDQVWQNIFCTTKLNRFSDTPLASSNVLELTTIILISSNALDKMTKET